MFKQHEAYFELKWAREREYYKVEEFLIELEITFVDPKIKEPRWINANSHREIDLEMTITTLDTKEKFDIQALLDSGCMSSAM